MSAQSAKTQLGIVRPASGEYPVYRGGPIQARPVREYSFMVDEPGQIVVREYGPGQMAPKPATRKGLRATLRDGTTVVITHRPSD